MPRESAKRATPSHRKLALIVALLGLCASIERAPAITTSVRESSPRLEIVSFTGQVQVKMPVSDENAPPRGSTPGIPPGSEVVVLNGRAVFQSRDLILRANQGDAFVFHVPLPIGGHQRAILLGALGSDTAIELELGSTKAILRSGAAVAIREDGPGKARLEIVLGNVVVSTPERIASMSPGAWVRASVAEGARALAGAERLPFAEREELRSAPSAEPDDAPAAAPEASPAPQSNAAPRPEELLEPGETLRDALNCRQRR
ncbi:MAG: hypothetical protein HY554_15785, partial [Elusimicrobia bacterium]|nr:hypothetical protein [Elusimicrobiota bacterium]